MKIIEPAYKWDGLLTKRKRTDTVILHHAEASKCSALDIDRWHKGNGWAGIGYHYVVRKNGTVERGRPENMIGAHAGSKNNYNSRSIGICFEGKYMTETMPAAQLEAGKELLRDIMWRYGKLNVLAHRDVTSTDCPGKNFPMDKLKHYDDTEDEEMVKYKTLNDVPAWGKPAVQAAMNKTGIDGNKILSGTGGGNIDLTETDLRAIVREYRCGLYK